MSEHMGGVTQIRPWRLEDLVLTEREQRIYNQGYEHGRKAEKPRKTDPFERGLRRRIARFRERADLARTQGDDARAVRLDRWADDEAALLAERFGEDAE